MKKLIKCTDDSINNIIDDIEDKIDELDVESSEDINTDYDKDDIEEDNYLLHKSIKRTR